jgi:hypothetical protein
MKVLGLVRSYWAMLSVAFLAMLVTVAAGLLEPWPVNIVVDYVIG